MQTLIARHPWIPNLPLAVVLLLTPAIAGAAEHFVAIDSATLSFEPAELTIQVGDTVTWTNDGGLHNVVADDDSFTSGPPSDDLWVFSHTFHHGGAFPYSCEVHVAQGMVGTVTVEGILADDFEGGDTAVWSDILGGRETCTCYFSSDCAGSTFCDYGPGGFGTEDICTWVDGKPNGNPGTACDLPHVGPWGGPICDGICTSAEAGSQIGWEPSDLIELGVYLWAEALLQPAEAGGGVPDPALVEEVMGLDFESPEIAINLGRQVNDVLILSGSPAFYEHFCHHEQHPNEPDPALWVDLSEDSCRAGAARLAVDALLAELDEPGSGAGFVDQIPKLCDDWQQLFSSPCAAGAKSLACVRQRIAEAAVFLATPQDRD